MVDDRMEPTCGGLMSRRSAVIILGAALIPITSACGAASYVTPEQFGAKGDGKTIDTDAINRALAHLGSIGGGDLRFSSGTYLINGPLDGRSLRNARLSGTGAIKAAGGTTFRFLLTLTDTQNVTIEGLTFDANKAARMVAQQLSCLDASGSTSCTLLSCTFKNALGRVGEVGVSSVAVSASNRCTRLIIDRCTVLDCGISAISRPSDGIFVRGNDCVIRQCHAENVTDHAFVLEGCNRSRIEDCSAVNCTSIAAISNDMSDDIEGNLISGITGTSRYFGSFGGVVGVYALGKGKIRNTSVRNVDITAADRAAGQGVGAYFYGGLENVVIDNLFISAGRSRGVMTHAAALDGVSSLRIMNARLRADSAGSCIRLINRSSNVDLVRNTLENGEFGIYADGASTFVDRGTRFLNCKTKVGLAGRASYRREA